MFVDEARIRVKAGDGGRGCISFRREAHVPRGGPDGGDGGDGGSIYFVASRSYRTLSDQRYQQQYRAENGAHGRGKTMHGRRGADLIISVPLGTIVEGAETRVRYGAADGSSSHETRVGQTLAHGWDAGSALLMYEYWDRTPLSASDRSNSSSAALPFLLLDRPS